MNTISNLLVLKESSKQVAHHTKHGCEIDHANIADHTRQINEFLDMHEDWGLVIVCSAARKLLGRDGWDDITQEWATGLSRKTRAGQFTEASLAGSGLERTFTAAQSGIITLANGHDAQLHRDSRLRNNDFLAADIASQAALGGMFDTVVLGKFTNVAGVLSGDTVLAQIDDIESVRHLAYDIADYTTTGGMATKFEAAEAALGHGVDRVWLADGRAPDALLRAHYGEIGTTFVRSAVEVA